jgi:chromosome segregation ATPase
MTTPSNLELTIARIEDRLCALDKKVEQLLTVRHKSMEWLATMAEQVESLDAFREEVRASLEPLFDKLRNLDEINRILRHATSDVARRVDEIEGLRRKAG